MPHHGSKIAPSLDENAADEVGNQRTKHLRRESCIRIAGLIGLILAGCTLLTFGFGTLYELYRQDEAGIEQWVFGRRVARMTCVISTAGHRIRHELGFVPVTELGSVGSDHRDDVTTSGSRLPMAVAEPNCKPRN